MNRIPFLLLAAVWLFTWPGCNKNDENDFRVDLSSEFQIKGGIGLNVLVEYRLPLSTAEVDSALAVRGLSPADVTDLYLNYVGLEIIRPFGSVFSFLQQMELLVVAPGLPELLLATEYDFTAGADRFIELEPTLVPIQTYFQTPQAQLVVRLIAKEFVLQNLDVALYQGYRVRTKD